MSLSSSTLALFILLIPGFVFRFLLYLGLVVNRPIFSDNTLYSSVAILLQAIAVHISTAVLVSGLVFLTEIGVRYFWPHVYPLQILNIIQSLEILDLTKWSGPTYVCVGLYFCAALLVACLLARIIQAMTNHSHFVRRLLFGPLADLIGPHRVNVLTAFILTRVTHQHKRLVYAGLPKEIGLREGSKIDYIVLQSPQKFYLQLNTKAPGTTLDNARPIGGASRIPNLLFIAGSEVENVHFESWQFDE